MIAGLRVLSGWTSCCGPGRGAGGKSRARVMERWPSAEIALLMVTVLDHVRRFLSVMPVSPLSLCSVCRIFDTVFLVFPGKVEGMRSLADFALSRTLGFDLQRPEHLGWQSFGLLHVLFHSGLARQPGLAEVGSGLSSGWIHYD